MSNYGAFNENNPVWKGVNRVVDMVLMGILFWISCIPIFTIGAAISGFYYAAMDSMRKEDGYIFKRYFTAFGKNFKKGTLIWLIMLVSGGLFGMNIYCWVKNSSMSIAPVMLGLSILACIIWLIVFIFVFPLQARFENSVGKTIENAFLLGISHLMTVILITILLAIVAYLAYLIRFVVVFLLLLGTGIVGYLIVRFFEQNFVKWGYIEEDDGKVEDDDYDFEVEVDYDELYGRNKDEEDE